MAGTASTVQKRMLSGRDRSQSCSWRAPPGFAHRLHQRRPTAMPRRGLNLRPDTPTRPVTVPTFKPHHGAERVQIAGGRALPIFSPPTSNQSNGLFLSPLNSPRLSHPLTQYVLFHRCRDLHPRHPRGRHSLRRDGSWHPLIPGPP
jgi:hypothetical protein